MYVMVKKSDLMMFMNGNPREQIIARQHISVELAGDAVITSIQDVVSNIGEALEGSDSQYFVDVVSKELDNLVKMLELTNEKEI